MNPAEDNPIDFHSAVLSMVKQALSERGEALSASHLRADSEERMSAQPGEDREIVVYFWRGKSVFDVIEFHTIRNGQPEDTLGALTRWFLEQVDSTLKSARVG